MKNCEEKNFAIESADHRRQLKLWGNLYSVRQIWLFSGSFLEAQENNQPIRGHTSFEAALLWEAMYTKVSWLKGNSSVGLLSFPMAVLNGLFPITVTG